MAGVPRYRQGRILWARLRAGSGKRELHPAAILTPTPDILQPEQFDPRKNPAAVNAVAVIGISTEFAKYPPCVLLPYSSQKGGHPMTKLTRECAACIGWYDWVTLEDDVEARGGDVPPIQMDEIVDGVVNDLKKKLAARAQNITMELVDLQDLLSRLIGEP